MGDEAICNALQHYVDYFLLPNVTLSLQSTYRKDNTASEAVRAAGNKHYSQRNNREAIEAYSSVGLYSP